ncbi:STE-12 alpha [Lentinula aciculospora]|uniref:STE-12 alpha n=1 Tax=Lentinula aciculospora TaxID=153920 RepID=A0A9W9DX19_9AGAR|nr:STE-12 alpha [Lentinula aciculospora]
MSRTQLQPLQLNSLPKAHEHDEYTARPGGARSVPSWNTAPINSSSRSAEESFSSTIDLSPGLPLGLSRSLNQIEQEKLAQLDRLKFFLATAPSRWDSTGPNASTSSSDPYLNMGMGMNSGLNVPHHSPAHPALNRFLLPSQEYVTCVLWNGLYHITGTDIVRALVFRHVFDAFGRPVRNMKKFEEGVFSDLRNLKPGQDASLEEPKSPFLDLLFKYQCIRTQKKQKVFYWFSVPHDRLFLDALERDLKREKMGLESTTQVVGEPALSFVYDGAFKRSLYEQFVKAAGGKEGEGELERVVREENAHSEIGMTVENDPSGEESANSSETDGPKNHNHRGVGAPAANNPNSPFFNMFSLFEGSPTYKQRRKKPSRPSALSSAALASTTSAQHGIFPDGMAPSDDMMRGSLDLGYGQGVYVSNGFSGTAAVRVKQEPTSAADMFLMQARGDLSNAARPTLAEARGMKRHIPCPSNNRASPLSSCNSPSSVPPVPDASASFPNPIAIPSTSTSGAVTTIKAYACPLLSCGRFFKRMEHLKRHLCTHTMERPFVCTKEGCGKRFSRSDNLSQHLRVCKGGKSDVSTSNSDSEVSDNPNTEGDGLGLSGMEWGVNVGEWINSEMDEESQPSVSSAERDTDANMDPNPVPYNQQQSQQFYDSVGYTTTHRPQHHSSLDTHLVSSNTRHLRAPSPRQSLDSHLDAQSQWALRGTPSPAFSTISVPSLSPNRSSWGTGTSPRPYTSSSRQHLKESSEFGYGVDDSSVSYQGGSDSLPLPNMNLSVSAPSHTLVFDHNNLYPQGMPEPSRASFVASMGGLSVDSSTAGGPVRRHRSMTPSLMRGADGGFVRRPTSDGSSGDTIAGSVYHPYASSSRASSLSRGGGSVHSSPAGHTLPLPGMGMQRSDSRASSLSVEVSGSDHLQQARQMLSRPSSVDPAATSYPGEVYRTDSPAPFANHQPTGSGRVTDSPATFVVDLPQPGSSYQQSSHIHSATVPAQFGMSVVDEQYGMQGMNGGNVGFYPHHVSTI